MIGKEERSATVLRKFLSDASGIFPLTRGKMFRFLLSYYLFVPTGLNGEQDSTSLRFESTFEHCRMLECHDRYNYNINSLLVSKNVKSDKKIGFNFDNS